MANGSTHEKQQAHELIELMAPGQVAAVVALLEIMLNPLARTHASAPYEDELISEAETRSVAASREWLKHNEGIPTKDVLAEFGLSIEDFERMGRTPLESQGPDKRPGK
jgi:hypothetical protein